MVALRTPPWGRELLKGSFSMIVGVEVESKKKKKIRGQTRSEDNIATVPQQQRHKACWVF
jgi:hypothetical protein